MAVLKLNISTGKSKETLRQEFERSTSSKYATVQSMGQFLQSIVSGNQVGQPPSVISSIQEYATRASGTFTLTSVVATDAISINGVTFTAVASGATGNQFNVGASDTITAANLAAAINASVTALVAGYVTATSAATVVTVRSTDYGIFGNQTLIASADGTIVASGARLTGGAVDSGAKTYTF
jgi:phage tail sheath gpL-like